MKYEKRNSEILISPHEVDRNKRYNTIYIKLKIFKQWIKETGD